MPYQIFTSYEQLPDGLHETLDRWYETEIVNDDAYQWIEEWSDADFIFIDFDNTQWMSVVNLYHRTIRVGDQPLRVGGISAVMTHPDYRGRGLAPWLIDVALRKGRVEWQIDHALLTCKRAMIPYYEKHGWQLLDADIYCTQGTDRVSFNRELVVGMVYSYGDATFPDGDIDMNGPPW